MWTSNCAKRVILMISFILQFVTLLIAVCPDNKPEVNCPFNLCDHQKCLNFPDANCVFDLCGGCTARFYAGDREVTDDCGIYNFLICDYACKNQFPK